MIAASTTWRRCRRSSWLVLALALAPTIGAAQAPQAPRPIAFADIATLKEPTATLLHWSRDSRFFHLAIKPADAATTEIVRISVADGARATLGSFPGAGFALSPSGESLVHVDQGEWKLVDLRNGQSRVLFKSAGQLGPARPAWSRDGRYVAIAELVQPAGLPRLDPATIEQANGVRVQDVGAAADALIAKLQASSLTVFDVRTGSQVHKVEGYPFIMDVSWGAASRLYYSTQDNPDLASWRAEIRELDVAANTERSIFKADALIRGLAVAESPDGKSVLTTYNFERPDQDNFRSLVLIDRATRATRRLSGAFRTGGAEWLPDGKSAICGERRYGFTQLSRVALDGRTQALTEDLANHLDLRVAPDGSAVVYLAKDGIGGQRVTLRSLRDDSSRTLVDVVSYRDRFVFGAFESARWTTRDGVAQHGFLVKPPGFDPNRKYPVIVDIHGGGPGASLFLFGPLWATHLLGPLEWHAWAALGYVVLIPEVRSSGEMSEAASRYDLIRDTGGVEPDIPDIASATDWILSRPYIDAKRATLFGLSAGGGRVNKFLTVDHRYAAGVILDPVRSGPLESLITQALPPYTGVRIGPQPCLDALMRSDTSLCDPGFLFDGYKNTTPTLIFVGNVELGAVAGFSMDVLFTIMRKTGTPARMLRYLAEGHGSGSAASAMHKTEEMKKWMETYLPKPL